MSDNMFLSVLAAIHTEKPVIHALRCPGDATEDEFKLPMSLACNGDVVVYGRRRDLVPASDLECKDCRRLAGLRR